MREIYASQTLKGCIALFVCICMAFLPACHEKQNIIHDAKGSQLLDTLNNICKNTVHSSLDISARNLEREALKQKNDLYTGHAYYHLCRYYISTYENKFIGKELADS